MRSYESILAREGDIFQQDNRKTERKDEKERERKKARERIGEINEEIVTYTLRKARKGSLRSVFVAAIKILPFLPSSVALPVSGQTIRDSPASFLLLPSRALPVYLASAFLCRVSLPVPATAEGRDPVTAGMRW